MNKAEQLLKLLNEDIYTSGLESPLTYVGDVINDLGISLRVDEIYQDENGDNVYTGTALADGTCENGDEEIPFKAGDKLEWSNNGIRVL